MTTRWLLLASLATVCVCACNKKKEEPPAPAPTGPPKVGHAKLHMGSGDPSGDSGDSGTQATADVPVDAGLAKPAYRDGDGRVHGPGGEVSMGGGGPCDGSHDHCLREGVWFQVNRVVSGKLYRATPCYEFEGKWYDWHVDPQPTDTDGKVYLTELAGSKPIAAGTTVIAYLSDDTEHEPWATNQYDALNASSWDAVVTEAAASGGKVRIAGWGTIPTDAVRLIVDTRSAMGTGSAAGK